VEVPNGLKEVAGANHFSIPKPPFGDEKKTSYCCMMYYTFIFLSYNEIRRQVRLSEQKLNISENNDALSE
jgi:hypothetical protein